MHANLTESCYVVSHPCRESPSVWTRYQGRSENFRCRALFPNTSLATFARRKNKQTCKYFSFLLSFPSPPFLTPFSNFSRKFDNIYNSYEEFILSGCGSCVSKARKTFPRRCLWFRTGKHACIFIRGNKFQRKVGTSN